MILWCVQFRIGGMHLHDPRGGTGCEAPTLRVCVTRFHFQDLDYFGLLRKDNS